MSANTKIEWCDHTFNPWEGCQKVGPGCDNCYAETRNARFGGGVASNWGPGAPRRRTSASNWNKPRAWNAAHAEFLMQHGRRQRVFCASLADVFDNAVEPLWRAELFDLIAATPQLDWLLLTKRIGNAWKMMADACGVSIASARLPLPNLWLGATITSQAEADRDIPKLLDVPAQVRFLSMEPLLGPVDLMPAYLPCRSSEGMLMDPSTGAYECCRQCDFTGVGDEFGIDWVIVGGESGPGARPMHPDWVRSLRDQCSAAGVPFLFKQWGEWRPISDMNDADYNVLYRSTVKAKPHEDQSALDDSYGRSCIVQTGVVHNDGALHGINWGAFQQGKDAMQVFKVGKKAAGRLLDGREWNEVPA